MSEPLEIVILEDDPRRRAAMRAALADRLPQYPPRFFTTAPEIARHLHGRLSRALVVVLDHDLDAIPIHPRRSLDAGTGRDVAALFSTNPLAARRPACPVVIHTTNRPAAVGMERELSEAGWAVSVVVPHGDLEWIAADWLRAVRDAAVSAAVPAEPRIAPPAARAA